MNVWKQAAEEEEILVPIRIAIDHEGIKYRDEFTWNLNGIFLPSLCYFKANLRTNERTKEGKKKKKEVPHELFHRKTADTRKICRDSMFRL